MKNVLFCLKLSLIFMLLLPISLQLSFSEKSFVLFAQTTDECEEQLNKAQEEYNLGNFQKALDLIEPCLKRANVSEAQKGRGYRLLGLVYIGQQLQKEANEAVKNLLLMVPNYKINPDTDPPQLKKIIDETVPTLVPKILNITPSSINEGENSFTITVNGSNFVYGTEVRFNGKTRLTTFVNTVELKAEITKDDIIEEGDYDVNVYSPIMGGKISNTEKFKVIGTSGFPWTWVAIGGGALAAGAIAIITMGGKSEKSTGDNGTTSLADPPGRP